MKNETFRNWGYAKEYVESMWLMLQQPEPEDFVVATGIGATAAQFCERAFSRLELHWKDFVVQDPLYLRPSEVDALVGDASKASRLLNWTPKTTWEELADLMVDSDLKLLQQVK